MISGCDSGVTNIVFAGGCSLSDQLGALRAAAKNHGQYTSAVAALLNDLVANGTLTGAEKGAIQNCAARSK